MEKKDYKDTLNLPKTGFPMKANLPTREPETIKRWDEEGIYTQMAERNSGKDTYILHDGPPYANGHIHIGHALNKILKDMIVKYRNMSGYHAPYVPGWDCHGLPIELEVDKKLGNKKRDISIPDKRQLCREYATKFIDIQREEFKRLGVLGNWDEPYLTMNFDYQARIVAEFLELFKNGYAYKGKKPVHWCGSCITALAEAEVEHADKISPSVFVKFIMDTESVGKLGIEDGSSFLIWTTTPWTLPSNLALAVNENITYAAVKANDGSTVIVAEALADVLVEKEVIADSSAIQTWKGSELTGLKAAHPFLDRASLVITADFVSTEDGSGIVHIAPGHGQDDYEAGLAHGLEILAPVNDYGKFEGSGVEEIERMQVFKANEPIIDILKTKGALLKQEDIEHSYPHCWRCKKPLIFRATEQWFIAMEHKDLRKLSLEEVEKVQWVPEWGKERIKGMIAGRPDWCISRQRTWGVPIAVFKCKGCGEFIKDEQVLNKVIDDFRAHSADIWFSRTETELLPEGFACSCGSTEFEKETDILDVWFDSGVSHAATLIKERGLSWPADLYLEGSDQHRGWFQSSMLASMGSKGQAPYRTVLTHGFAMDGKGKKMSKSLGNVVAPQDIIKKTGAEILRLWVSAEDYSGDVRISNEIIARLVDAYRKIRNTSKYLLGNISDFDGGDYSADLLEVDRWAMSRLQGLTHKVNDAYEKFNFHEIYHTLYNFCIVDMSSFYLDILKDRLYTFKQDSKERRAAQWVLNEMLMTMTRLMAPVLSFTAEEIWSFIENTPEKSVFLADFPTVREEFIDKELEARWARLIAVREEVNKALELKRAEKFIGNALEAKVTVHIADSELLNLINEYSEFLPTLFIVSQAKATAEGEGAYRSEEVNGLSISVEQAEGEKCQRCWNRSIKVGTFDDAPEICERCHENIT
ncbi:isoleucine--tRNA ligase [Nitrospirota bacterium]